MRVRWDSPAVLVTAVVAIHLFLGFTSANPAIHPGGDNAAYISLAHALVADGAYSQLWDPGAPPHTQYPPLYPGVLALLILAGAKSWGAFKALSLVLTGLATAFCFLWCQRLHGPRIAAVIALLFGVAPGVLIAAQWILAEPLFMMLLFAALWLLTPDQREQQQRRPGGEATSRRAKVELGVGLVLAIAAYFTRSAGLPLVVAVAAWLVLARRWAALGLFAGLFGVAAAPWHMRAGGEYLSAFWMVNPYAPDQGRADIADLAVRVWDNLWQYTSEIIPTSVTDLTGTVGVVFGVLLTALVAWGWILRIRKTPGVPEFFFLLYTGLILVWPSVWSSDRFALPIIPLVLLYAGEGLASVTAGVTRWRPAIFAGIAGLALLLPAGSSWLERADLANRCRIQVRTSGPMGCYSTNISELQAMALWARDRLPEGSVVAVRKPRLFYAFSGHPAVVYPFTNEEGRLLAEADSIGVDYVVLGNWDQSGAAYVVPAVQADPRRFCLAAQLRAGSGPPISLLAIRGPEPDDSEAPADAADGVANCLDEEWGTLPSSAATASTVIPILNEE